MKIYLAGSVPKGDAEAKVFIDWRKVYSEEIAKSRDDIELFNPTVFLQLEGDSQAVTGADCWSIQKSDLVIVNAESKLGAGTAMELVVAKYFSKPVISVLPKDSHHRRSQVAFEGKIVEDWIHPFIDTFSDEVVEDIKQVPAAITKVKTRKIKSISVIDEAIDHAKELLQNDNV